jgi:hypothetical protein
MTTISLILSIATFVLIFLWIKTGRSPFWWGAVALLFMEAVRIESWESIVPAAREFWRRVQVRLLAVRGEFGTGV